jgi:hypothetical protein
MFSIIIIDKSNSNSPHKEKYGSVVQATTRASQEPAGMLRIAGSQMAWEGCAAIQTHF